MEKKYKVRSDCINASNPFHVCADYCLQRSQNPNVKINGPKSPDQNQERVGEDRRNIDPNCVNASNPFHECRGYCTKKTGATTNIHGTGKAESIKEQVKQREAGRTVDPICVRSSDPLHQCREYCSERNGEERKTNRQTLGVLLARESEEVLHCRENRKEEAVIGRNKKVDPRCPNALNPFHECAEYCLQKISGSGRIEGDRSKRIGSGRSAGGKSDGSMGRSNIVMDKRDVDPRCANASNPFHKCAEYCFERIREAI